MDNKEVLHTVERLFLSVPVIFYLVMLIFLAFISDSPVGAVFLGMIVSLIHLVVLILLTAYKKNHHWVIWVIPLALVVVFGFVANSKDFSLLQNMEMPAVITLNVVISFLLNLLFYNPKYIGSDKEAERLREELEKMKHEHASVTQESMQTSLRSIEDKCKAYNFVIGRVYSDKKGGSVQIREKINIPRELYNRFTELADDLEETSELHKILQDILHRLELAEKNEEELFTVKKTHLEMKRSPGDSVLQVMANNDKDPVRDYHAEAKEICVQILDFIKK